MRAQSLQQFGLGTGILLLSFISMSSAKIDLVRSEVTADLTQPTVSRYLFGDPRRFSWPGEGINESEAIDFKPLENQEQLRRYGIDPELASKAWKEWSPPLDPNRFLGIVAFSEDYSIVRVALMELLEGMDPLSLTVQDFERLNSLRNTDDAFLPSAAFIQAVNHTVQLRRYPMAFIVAPENFPGNSTIYSVPAGYSDEFILEDVKGGGEEFVNEISKVLATRRGSYPLHMQPNLLEPWTWVGEPWAVPLEHCYWAHATKLFHEMRLYGEPSNHVEGHIAFDTWFAREKVQSLLAIATYLNQWGVNPRVFEIGFNLGYSSLALLLGGPKIDITSFDIAPKFRSLAIAERFVNAEFGNRHRVVLGSSAEMLPLVIAMEKAWRQRLPNIIPGLSPFVALSQLVGANTGQEKSFPIPSAVFSQEECGRVAIDLVFVDGKHTLEFVITDVLPFREVCKTPGRPMVILVDDMLMGEVSAGVELLIRSNILTRDITAPWLPKHVLEHARRSDLDVLQMVEV